jgi:DNA helicase-2/ATP-dependent DNA helicase PcrA
VPNRYAGKKFIHELEDYAQWKELHLYEALRKMPIELPYIRKFMKDLVKFLDPLMEDASSLEPAEVIALLRNSLDYDRVCTEEDLPSPDDVKIQNINEFQLAATKFTDLQSFLDYTDTFQDELVHDKDGVSLMTIHKAKGLQFPVVFVVGMVEGIMPPKKADIEEERRVCFVSISRAMKLLYLSYSHNHLGQPAKKSIFLDEILGIKDKETPS